MQGKTDKGSDRRLVLPQLLILGVKTEGQIPTKVLERFDNLDARLRRQWRCYSDLPKGLVCVNDFSRLFALPNNVEPRRVKAATRNPN